MADPELRGRGWPAARRASTVAVATVVALAVIAALTARRGGPSLPLPEQDEVVATFLADGTPVFVVVDEYGLRVLDAISPHTTSGKLVYWCTTSRTFRDAFHGSELDARGDYLGGPAPRGLVTYAATVEDGRVRVGELQDPVERFARPTLPREGEPCTEDVDDLDATTAVAHGRAEVLHELGGDDERPTLDHPYYGHLEIVPAPVAPAD